MAQTKKKRRTKHRGTAAGTISNRGRTGRPPSAGERKKQTREQLREARLNKPPTWEAAIKRAVLAAALMFLFLLVTSKGNVLAAIVFAIFALALYVPSGYYLEMFMYRRRMRKREGAKLK
jgi:Flp pilus assembly protein TadB